MHSPFGGCRESCKWRVETVCEWARSAPGGWWGDKGSEGAARRRKERGREKATSRGRNEPSETDCSGSVGTDLELLFLSNLRFCFPLVFPLPLLRGPFVFAAGPCCAWIQPWLTPSGRSLLPPAGPRLPQARQLIWRPDNKERRGEQARGPQWGPSGGDNNSSNNRTGG